MTPDLLAPLNLLLSYFYWSKHNLAEIQSWGTRLVGDSGAYSAMSQGQPIDHDRFLAWATRWRDITWWTAALDVIGDADRTWDYWKAAPDDLNLVPTVHYPSPPQSLDRYVDAGATLIGLGGMVPFKSEPERLLRWCLSMFRYARDTHPGVRFHGWGVTHPQLLTTLPWWSIDSSGYGSSYIYGRMRLWNPDTNRKVMVTLNGTDLAEHSRLLRRHYHADWQDLLTSHPGNRGNVFRVSARSMQHEEAWLRARHQVTPPAMLKDSPTGPNILYATTAPVVVREGTLDTHGPHILFATGAPNYVRSGLDPKERT